MIESLVAIRFSDVRKLTQDTDMTYVHDRIR